MWLIAKINKKEKKLLHQDLKKKLGENIDVYAPKILIEKFIKNNFNKKIEIDLLGDYIFYFHKSFKNKNALNSIKYCRGLKYFLSGFETTQKDINNFINFCKKSENKKGFLSYNFFQLNINKNYKILSGPFIGQIVKILSMQKNKIDFMLGNIKTSVYKERTLFKPA